METKKTVRTKKTVAKATKSVAKAKKEDNALKYDKLPAKSGYVEPSNYIPKELRKKYGLGEYYKEQPEKKTVKKTSK